MNVCLMVYLPLLGEHLKTTVILCGFEPVGFGCVFKATKRQ